MAQIRVWPSTSTGVYIIYLLVVNIRKRANYEDDGSARDNEEIHPAPETYFQNDVPSYYYCRP